MDTHKADCNSSHSGCPVVTKVGALLKLWGANKNFTPVQLAIEQTIITMAVWKRYPKNWYPCTLWCYCWQILQVYHLRPPIC